MLPIMPAQEYWPFEIIAKMKHIVIMATRLVFFFLVSVIGLVFLLIKC